MFTLQSNACTQVTSVQNLCTQICKYAVHRGYG